MNTIEITSEHQTRATVFSPSIFPRVPSLFQEDFRLQKQKGNEFQSFYLSYPSISFVEKTLYLLIAGDIRKHSNEEKDSPYRQPTVLTSECSGSI
jgi:hypothetical protein